MEKRCWHKTAKALDFCMQKQKTNALYVVEATLNKSKKVTRPVAKFITHIVQLWLGMSCRYRFTNMERWGSRTQKSYRNGFKKFFDWFSFNFEIVSQHGGKEIIAVFDPSYIKKSGKQTVGSAIFWSGVHQKALKGLEIGCLAFVDIAAATALHGLAVQTPGAKELKEKAKTLVSHYVSVIKKQVGQISAVTRYLPVDGYFMKKEFIHPLVKQGLHVITKARSDPNLMYRFNGKQKNGRR